MVLLGALKTTVEVCLDPSAVKGLGSRVVSCQICVLDWWTTAVVVAAAAVPEALTLQAFKHSSGVCLTAMFSLHLHVIAARLG